MTKRRKWLILLLPLGIAVLCLMLKLYLEHIAVLHIPCMLWFLTGLYCPGCGGGDGNQSCAIAQCSRNHGVRFCCHYSAYPC